MSTDYNKVLICDDRISNLTDKIDYAVMKGSQQCTVSEIVATSATASSIVFNVVVPSLETIIDRRVMIKTTLILKITGNVAEHCQLLAYGVRDSLCAFPMHSLMNTLAVTINNNTVSMNVRDVLPAVLRLLDNRELAHYNNTTPVMYDSFLNYKDTVGQPNSQFSDSFANYDQFMKPRGAFALDSCTEDEAGTTPLSPGADADPDKNPKEAYVKVTLLEPLMISPFIYGQPTSNNQGMYGVQNMSIQMNLGSANRIWRHADGGKSYISGVTLHKVEKSTLQFTFLSAHPSQQLSSRCVVPYYTIPHYITNGVKVPKFTLPAGGIAPTVSTQVIQSSTISFNQIPDKLIVFLRKPLGEQDHKDSDSFLTIEKINLNWDNSSGVCTSYTQSDLWRMSVESGSNQSWDEFRGLSYRKTTDETKAGDGAGGIVPTCGSVCALEFGRHIPMFNDYHAPGSIGQYSFQISVTCKSYYDVEITPELVVCCVNSGVFVTEKGSSQTYTAMLTKQDVLEASQMQAVSHSEARRMVGGGFLDSLKSVFRWIANPDNRKAVGSVVRTGMDIHDVAKGSQNHTKNRQVLGMLGGARSGGGLSGGLMSRLK